MDGGGVKDLVWNPGVGRRVCFCLVGVRVGVLIRVLVRRDHVIIFEQFK